MAQNNPLVISVIAAIPLPTLWIAPDQRLAAMNPQAEALFGKAILGRHHAMALRQPEMQQALTRALTQGQTTQARHSVSGPSHDIIYQVRMSPLEGIGGVLCVFEDITAREKIEEMRREFIANVSHELRSPLTAVMGFIETLRGPARDDPAARLRFLAIMERETERMSRLVNDLLRLGQVEATERIRPTDLVDIFDILQSNINTLQPILQESGVAVHQHISAIPTIIPADRDQLMQVFRNLMENALKYGASGGSLTVRVMADTLPKSPALRVEISDQGDGIDAEHIPRLTERFYRADSHRAREKGGTGLGLAIVKHIVQRHRGRLEIHSEKGKGSTFSVILPYEINP